MAPGDGPFMPARSEPPPVTDGEVDGDWPVGDGEPSLLERPGAGAAASAVRAALESGQLVSLVGECEVRPGGGERLPPADHHALVKPDGSVVVHGRGGTAPVFELAGRGGLDVAAVDGALEVMVPGDGAGRRLRFGRVDVLVRVAVDPPADDGTSGGSEGAADPPGPERDRHAALRERLLAEPDAVEPGFRPLATERETPAGPVDLYGRDAEGRAVVVEIKADRAGPAAIGQLDRYVDALRRDLHADADVRGVLVAPSATDRARRLLEQRGYGFRAVPPTE